MTTSNNTQWTVATIDGPNPVRAASGGLNSAYGFIVTLRKPSGETANTKWSVGYDTKLEVERKFPGEDYDEILRCAVGRFVQAQVTEESWTPVPTSEFVIIAEFHILKQLTQPSSTSE